LSGAVPKAEKPRWSKEAPKPVSRAGLPGRSAIVRVGPP
jgi:hypothetical protein